MIDINGKKYYLQHELKIKHGLNQYHLADLKKYSGFPHIIRLGREAGIYARAYTYPAHEVDAWFTSHDTYAELKKITTYRDKNNKAIGPDNIDQLRLSLQFLAGINYMPALMQAQSPTRYSLNN